MSSFCSFPTARGVFALQRRILSATAVLSLTLFSLPAEADEGHEDSSHAHEGLHFSHPLITESPSPDTKVRLDGRLLDEEEDELGTLRLVGEYAFFRSFSLEVDLPFSRRSPSGADSESRLGNVGLGLKFANFAFEDRGLLLGYGLELGLPTGDEEDGIGSDHLLEIEPFLALGYKRRGFELATFFEFGIPTNQAEDEEVETELGWTLSLLYHFSPRIQGLLELDGESVLSGEERGESVLNVSPGVKFRPIDNTQWWIGVSLGLPVSDREEFDTRALLSAFYHFS